VHGKQLERLVWRAGCFPSLDPLRKMGGGAGNGERRMGALACPDALCPACPTQGLPGGVPVVHHGLEPDLPSDKSSWNTVSLGTTGLGIMLWPWQNC